MVLVMPNGPRLSCGALTKDAFLNLRAASFKRLLGGAKRVISLRHILPSSMRSQRPRLFLPPTPQSSKIQQRDCPIEANPPHYVASHADRYRR
jgi:hypothetical protein